MELTGSEIGQLATGAMVAVGGVAFAMQKLVKTWTGTRGDIAKDSAQTNIIEVLQSENKSLREALLLAQNERNNSMKELGKIEMMQTRIDELKKEISDLRDTVNKLLEMNENLVRQNLTLTSKLEP